MAGRIEGRLRELGLVLPTAAVPMANYVPMVVSGSLAVVSGQVPQRDGVIAYRGKVGAAASAEDARAAAGLCFLGVLAQLRGGLGDLDRVVRVVRLGGFIATVPEFTDLATAMNGASDLAVAVFGEAGRHARSTIGVPCLPGDATVEVEGMFEVA